LTEMVVDDVNERLPIGAKVYLSTNAN